MSAFVARVWQALNTEFAVSRLLVKVVALIRANVREKRLDNLLSMRERNDSIDASVGAVPRCSRVHRPPLGKCRTLKL